MMRLGFVLVLFVFSCAGSSDVGMETVLGITRCRASCLDQFSHLIRTENNCHKDMDCFMCWETCEMLNTNFNIWGPMCSVPDICFPGCQKACQSLSSDNSLNETRLSSLAVKSVYDLDTDRVLLEWLPEEHADVEGITLYTVLLRDKNQEWEQIAQTTSHVVHVRGRTVNRDSAIRLLAANATHLLSYAETTYVNSLIRGTPMHQRNAGWGPQLVSMERSENSHSLLATITWSHESDAIGPNEYEVSWNVMDDAIEITGHLLTTKNMAVLTLWPDSIYLVQVKRHTSIGGDYSETSEPLVIDTKFVDKYPTISKSTTPPQCNEERSKLRTVVYLWILSLSLVLVMGFIGYMKMKYQKKSQAKRGNVDSTSNDDESIFKCFLKEELRKKISTSKAMKNPIIQAQVPIINPAINPLV